MLRGHLKYIVLKVLDEAEMTGYSLMKKIEDMIGKKPSSGSIYPLLDNLNEEKLITYAKKGRSKIYSITKKGKKHLKDAMVRHREIINKFSEGFKIMENFYDAGEKRFHKLIMEEIKDGKIPMLHLQNEIAAIKESLVPFMDPKHPNIKKIKKLLSDTNRKIKELQ